MKWGEYSSDVQFILQRSDQPKAASQDQAAKNPASSPPQANESPKKAKSTFDQSMPSVKHQSPLSEDQQSINSATSENIKMNEPRRNDLIGIVKGVPHTTMQNLTKISPPLSPCSSTTGTSITTTSDFADMDFVPSKPLQSVAKSPILQFNSADVRNSLDRKTSAFREVVNLNEDRTHRNTNSTNSSMSENSTLDSTTESYKHGYSAHGPPISSNGALVPPPYRNPPSPKTNSPLLHQYNSLLIHHQKTDSQSSGTTNSSSKLIDFATNKSSHFIKELSPSPTIAMAAQNRQASPNIHINALSNLQAIVNSATSDKDLLNDNQFQNAQYRELLQLIHLQREKINNQQSDISKVSLLASI